MTIEAKIASVISSREVAFNAGDVAGIELGHIATLYREVEVVDPDTGESLGRLRRSRLQFVITEVHDRVSVGRALGTVAKQDPFGTSLLGGSTQSREKVPLLVTDRPDKANYRTHVVEIGERVEIAPDESPF